MISTRHFHPFIAFVAVTSLAGCLGLGSNGGGGGVAAAQPAGAGAGGAPKSLNAFEREHDRVARLGQSTTPIKGEADYKGQVEVLTNANPQDTKEAVYGDLAMHVNFGAARNPISGTVGNFEGNIEGKPVSINGTLSTANAKASAANDIPVTTFNLPAPAVGTVTQTGIAATFRGKLDDPSTRMSGEAEMTLLGSFSGATGEGVFGSNGVMIQPDKGAMIITGGRFYADRQ